jgi:tetratricopeptide (TPR) repeat protein
LAPNKRKILEAARKHAQKGSKDRALKEYEKLLKLDPRDAKLRLEIGDAYRRWGQVDEAVTAYTKVAEQYMAEGFDARAVAVFKQIQNLDRERFDSYVPLAELYQRMGLVSEAIQSLQTAADGYHRQGRKRDALDLLRRMATLDPSNTNSRLKVADLLRQEKLFDEAIAEYEEVHAELERQGEREAAGQTLERILEIQPERIASQTLLARNLLQRGLADQAESYARRAVEAEPDQTDHYELLADVYRAQQRDEPLAETYRALAELYRRRGDEDRARDILQRFVPLDGFSAPLDDDAVLTAAGALDADELLGQEEPTLLDEHLLDEEVQLDDEAAPRHDLAEETVLELGHEPEAAPGPSLPRQLDDDLGAAPEGDPEHLLAEASVYLRYGKRDQALKNLESILSNNPEHRGALEKLGEAHADAGDASAAVDAWLQAADQARRQGDQDGLLVLRDRIAALDPGAAESLGLGSAEPEPELEEVVELGGDEPSPQLELEDPAPDEVELDIDDHVEIELEDGEADAPASSPAAQPDGAEAEPAGASVSQSEHIEEDLEEAEFYRTQGLFDEATAIYERVLERAPNHPLALVRLGEIEAERGGDPGAGGAAATDAVEPAAGPPEDLGVGDDLSDWSDGGLSDTDVDFDGPLVDEDASESEGVGIEPEPADDEAPPAPVAAAAEEPDEVEIEFDDDEPDADEDTDEDTDTASLDDSGEITGVELDVGGVETTAASPHADAVEEADASIDVEVPDEIDDEYEVEEPGPEPLSRDLPAFDDPDPGAASFDLAAELSDVFERDAGASDGNLGPGASDDGFAAVFREFKKGVSQALEEGDHEAHYDLGIAYREMGLLDDAIGEFRAAIGSPLRRVDGLHMLGLCCLEQGQLDEAVGHLREALETADVTQEQALAVRFELGRAFEQKGDVSAAREAWESVAAIDPGFCEVEERLTGLEEAKAEAAAPPAKQEFESFGDLFEDDDAAPQAGAPDARDDHESFEDLMEDDEDPDDASGPPAPAAEPEPAREAPPRPRRRKKKISFV